MRVRPTQSHFSRPTQPSRILQPLRTPSTRGRPSFSIQKSVLLSFSCTSAQSWTTRKPRLSRKSNWILFQQQRSTSPKMHPQNAVRKDHISSQPNQLRSLPRALTPDTQNRSRKGLPPYGHEITERKKYAISKRKVWSVRDQYGNPISRKNIEWD